MDQTGSTTASLKTTFGREPVVWLTAVAIALVHAATAGRYDACNELYFLACGWHPNFGYVDQPPLVPLIAAATLIFGAIGGDPKRWLRVCGSVEVVDKTDNSFAMLYENSRPIFIRRDMRVSLEQMWGRFGNRIAKSPLK
jgi:hypothetical protein